MNRLPLKDISRWTAILFFLSAGINHFVNPQFYLPLIPEVMPIKNGVNIMVGFLELTFGMGLINPSTRRTAGKLLMGLLVVLTWSHIYFIQQGSCVPEGLCIDPWIAWVRLIVVQPLLVWWIWTMR